MRERDTRNGKNFPCTLPCLDQWILFAILNHAFLVSVRFLLYTIGMVCYDEWINKFQETILTDYGTL